MCTPLPSATIWGTTHTLSTGLFPVPQVTTVPGAPTVLTTTIYAPPQCDPKGPNCVAVATTLYTTTPMNTITNTATVQTAMLVTQVVPQQTLYYPCTAIDDVFSKPVSESSSPTPGIFSVASTDSSSAPQTSSSTVTTAPSSSATSGLSTTSTTSSSSGIVSPSSDSPSSHPPSTLSSRSTASTIVASSSAASSAGDASTSSTHHTNKAVIGAVIGSVVGLILLIVLGLCLRSRDSDDQTSSRRSLPTRQDFWENRFRQLEADVESPSDEKGGHEMDGLTRLPDKKIRLTLNLASKTLPARPDSTVSSVSGFLVRGQRGQTAVQPQAQPFRGTRERSGPINFSRPRFGRSKTSSRSSRASGISQKSKVSMKSFNRWFKGGGAGGVQTSDVGDEMPLPPNTSTLEQGIGYTKDLEAYENGTETDDVEEKDPEILTGSYYDPDNAGHPFAAAYQSGSTGLSLDDRQTSRDTLDSISLPYLLNEQDAPNQSPPLTVESAMAPNGPRQLVPRHRLSAKAATLSQASKFPLPPSRQTIPSVTLTESDPASSLSRYPSISGSSFSASQPNTRKSFQVPATRVSSPKRSASSNATTDSTGGSGGKDQRRTSRSGSLSARRIKRPPPSTHKTSTGRNSDSSRSRTRRSAESPQSDPSHELRFADEPSATPTSAVSSMAVASSQACRSSLTTTSAQSHFNQRGSGDTFGAPSLQRHATTPKLPKLELDGDTTLDLGHWVEAEESLVSSK